MASCMGGRQDVAMLVQGPLDGLPGSGLSLTRWQTEDSLFSALGPKIEQSWRVERL